MASNKDLVEYLRKPAPINCVIELNPEQTRQFIHSLEHPDPKIEEARKRTIERARKTKFILL